MQAIKKSASFFNTVRQAIFYLKPNGFDSRKAKWFENGMDYAMRAPTAINQQKFLITLKDGKVSFKSFFGPCHKIDLGIVKYHFELGTKKADHVVSFFYFRTN